MNEQKGSKSCCFWLTIRKSRDQDPEPRQFLSTLKINGAIWKKALIPPKWDQHEIKMLVLFNQRVGSTEGASSIYCEKIVVSGLGQGQTFNQFKRSFNLLENYGDDDDDDDDPRIDFGQDCAEKAQILEECKTSNYADYDRERESGGEASILYQDNDYTIHDVSFQCLIHGNNQPQSVYAMKMDNNENDEHISRDSLPQMIDGYTLSSKLGSGGFGSVFQYRNSRAEPRQLVYKVSKGKSRITLYHESRIYNFLNYHKLEGIPACYGCYDLKTICTRNGCSQELIGYNANIHQIRDYAHQEEVKHVNETSNMVTMLKLQDVGPCLTQLLKQSPLGFSLKTTLLIGIQVLHRLQDLHEQTLLLHRDIKPQNFLYHQETDCIYMIDFGLAQPYAEDDCNGTIRHAVRTENRKFVGNALLASRAAHQGIRQSRKDDLESLCYMLISFLKTLPWNIKNKERGTKLKLKLKTRELCFGLPNEFLLFLDYCRTLEWSAAPNYDYLRGLLRTCFITNGFVDDGTIFE